MLVLVSPVSGSTVLGWPCPLSRVGSKKSSLEQHVAGNGLAVISLPFNLTAEQAVAETEGDGRELVRDRGVDVGVVALVRRKGVGTEYRRNPLVVDDRLVLSDVELAGFIEELVIGPSRIGFLQLGGNAVVIVEKHGLQGGQLEILVSATVAGDEHLRLGQRVLGRPCRRPTH